MKNRQISSKQTGWRRFLFHAWGLMMVAILALLAGCNPGDGGSDVAEAENGEISIGLTDAEGDFVTYKVAVTSLTLTKRNGAVVETLPLATEVDFAQYTEMTEFLTIATVPAGVYTHATLTLDYSNADIQVENANGDAVEVAQVKDEEGNAITTLELKVRLSERNQLTIAPGVPAHLTLDFDLAASNDVDMADPSQPVVTVQPFLVAKINPEVPKVHRLRGPLQEVDVAEGTFEVIVRPFLQSMGGPHSRFGKLEVVTSDATTYEIDSQNYQGQSGLEQLAEMPEFTAIVVLGDLRFNPRRFEAREVYAGSSVWGGEQDVVTGNVVRRDGSSLTVKGGMLVRDAGSVVLNDEITILLGDATRVTRQQDTTPYNSDAISVGQRIVAFGKLEGDASGGRVLDATAGQVRMVLTTLSGTVVAADGASQELILDLSTIGRYPVTQFDFHGTGSDSTLDADPDNYQVATAGLNISSISSGTPVKVRGFVQAFGAAPVDFTARTLIDVSAVHAVMRVNWQPASLAPFEELSSERMTLSLVGTGEMHHLGRAGVRIDLQDMAGSPTLEPGSGGKGRFLIVGDGELVLHTSFERFNEELQRRLADGEPVESLVAHGTYDDGQATLTTANVRVKMD